MYGPLDNTPSRGRVVRNAWKGYVTHYLEVHDLGVLCVTTDPCVSPEAIVSCRLIHTIVETWQPGPMQSELDQPPS